MSASSLYLLRVTDERVPDAGKKFFTFPLSIHGIERAGAEAGVRAAEDLATWAACEAGLATAPVACAKEGAIPHPLLETAPGASVTAGDALVARPSTSSSPTRTAGGAATSTTASASSSATTATAST